MHKPTQVTITREQLYKTVATPGPAWKYLYTVVVLDGKGNNHSPRGSSLAEAKAWAKQRAKELGGLPVVIDWEQYSEQSPS